MRYSASASDYKSRNAEMTCTLLTIFVLASKSMHAVGQSYKVNASNNAENNSEPFDIAEPNNLCSDSALVYPFYAYAGFWTSGQRVDPLKCATNTASDFRWKIDNGTWLPVDSSIQWLIANPNCDGRLLSYSPAYYREACLGITYFGGPLYLVDSPCDMPCCPICEMEM
jgi:hypothetical protein